MRKVTSIAVVVLALAATCVTPMASTASPTLASDSNGTSGNILSAVTTGSSTFTIGANSFTCTTWTLTGTISGSAVSVAASGTTWANCTYNIGGAMGNASVTDSSAWTFAGTQNLGAGSFSVAMTNGAMTLTAGLCTVKFPSATYPGLTWTNATKSLTFTISNVSYTSSGFICGLPASGNNAVWAGSWSEPTLTAS